MQCSSSPLQCDLVHGNIAQISFFVSLFTRILSNNIFVFWMEGTGDVMRILLTKSLEYISHCFGFIAPDYFLSTRRPIHLHGMHFYEDSLDNIIL